MFHPIEGSKSFAFRVEISRPFSAEFDEIIDWCYEHCGEDYAEIESGSWTWMLAGNHSTMIRHFFFECERAATHFKLRFG